MYDDEASTGVAYDIHDAPSLERGAEDTRAEPDDDRPPALPARARRFARSSTPVEPMS
jgi:hypothetical protein